MVNSARLDISNHNDVKVLVDQFYAKVNIDLLLAPVFAHVDWPHHLPIMYNFWSSVLLGDRAYSGNPLAKHMNLKIGKEHFTRWLELFTATVDEHFEGFNANEAKTRARTVADLFQFKMGLLGK
ncbi:MAG: group III truncated hemoglobin [Cyclobacteriaceae bacterium]|nr:group III truncated hemoglobin [Cyclobacteriaceae bacterium]